MDVNILLIVVISCISCVSASNCGICKQYGDVTECSGLGLEQMWPLPISCTVKTVTLNLNYNRLRYVPMLPDYMWRHLRTVYLLDNPLECVSVCGLDTFYTLLTSCKCGE